MTARHRPFAHRVLAGAVLCLLSACGDAPVANGIEVLHAFDGGDGAWSRGSLVRDGSTLYGRTAVGGAADSGTVFRIDADGSDFVVLHSFSAGGDNVLGNQPHHNAMLLRGTELLGAALYGGNQDNDQPDRVTGDFTSAAPPTEQLGNGTLFTIGKSGQRYQVLLELDGGAGAPALPHSPPVLGPDGRTLYGMTSSGGKNDSGTLYALGADGSGFRLLHSFAEEDGDEPHGMVSFDGAGNLLGMTRKGGTPASGKGAGVIFHHDLAAATYRVLHTFVAGSTSDGDTNDHGFLTLVDGVAYGTTELGGASLAGTLFAIREDGSGFELVHSFGASPGDGTRPYGSLVLLNGWLYGTTTAGGASGDGTLFRLRVGDRRYEMLVSFDRATSGAFPEDNVLPSADGRVLFGLTQAGGVNDPDAKSYFGTVFRFAIPDAP